MSTQTTPTPLPDVIAAIQGDSAAAAFTARAEGQLREGVRCEAAVRTHGLVIDEPLALGGTDAGPNPVELVLTALGTCQAITYRIWAALLDIRLDTVRFATEGDLDLRGLLGLAEGVRPGFTAVRHRIELVGPEPAERYEELARAVDAHCPVLDIVGQIEPVDRQVTITTT
jgi:uncharacterized OsmC-like protein